MALSKFSVRVLVYSMHAHTNIIFFYLLTDVNEAGEKEKDDKFHNILLCMHADKHKQLFIHLPCGQILCYKYKRNASNSQILETLINFIHSKTGVPKVTIKLIFRNVRIQTKKDIEMLPSQANIHLKLALFGGQDCDICGINNATMHCTDCNQYFCSECCDRVHSHPKRTNHSPSSTDKANSSTEILSQTSSNGTDDDTFCSQANISFHDAMLVATLAEKFGLTSFKTFQKRIIDATLEGTV